MAPPENGDQPVIIQKKCIAEEISLQVRIRVVEEEKKIQIKVANQPPKPTNTTKPPQTQTRQTVFCAEVRQ